MEFSPIENEIFNLIIKSKIPLSLDEISKSLSVPIPIVKIKIDRLLNLTLIKESKKWPMCYEIDKKEFLLHEKIETEDKIETEAEKVWKVAAILLTGPNPIDMDVCINKAIILIKKVREKLKENLNFAKPEK